MNLAQNWSNPSGAKPATLQDFEVVFAKATGILLAFAGIALFVMLLVGGFKFITAGANPDKAASAKSTITIAIVGIIVIILALLIFQLIETITGVTVTDFVIFNP